MSMHGAFGWGDLTPQEVETYIGCGKHEVFVTDDGIVPTCDICGGPQYVEGDNWNGETGNHYSCEEHA